MRATYANIASTLALVFSLGAGGAYAAATITGADIVDGSIKAPDLGANSVLSSKVRDDALTGNDIDESTLGQVPDAATVGGVPLTSIGIGRSVHSTGECNPNSTTFAHCLTLTTSLPRPARVLVIADATWYSASGGETRGTCRLIVDGVQQPQGVTPAQLTTATDANHLQSFELSQVDHNLTTGPVLGVGNHSFILGCGETSGDVRIHQSTISAVVLGSD